MGIELELDVVGLDLGYICGVVNMFFMDFLIEDGFEKGLEEFCVLF